MTGAGTDLPLAGLHVLVPRPVGRGDDLLAALRGAGAVPRHVPLIEIRPETASSAMARVAAPLAAGWYGWVALTSAAAVRAVRATADRLDLDPPVGAGTRVAAVGDATCAALREARIAVDLVPSGAGSAAALASALVSASTAISAPAPISAPAVISAPAPANRGGGRTVLLPRSDLARPDLPDALRANGFDVDEVTAYRTVRRPLPPDAARDLARGSIGAVLLTSPSTVAALAGTRLAAGTLVVAIGPTTARAAVAAGIDVTQTATRPDAAALTDALIRAVVNRHPATSRSITS